MLIERPESFLNAISSREDFGGLGYSKFIYFMSGFDDLSTLDQVGNGRLNSDLIGL